MALTFPKIGFGVYAIPRKETAKCVFNALEAGYRLIDTAACYYNERETAEGIRSFLQAHPEVHRSEITYTSKLWDDSFGTELAREGTQDSLDNAGEPIDLYLLHSSGNGPSERRESWLVLEDFVKRGQIRHIGVSNWGIKHLEEMKSYATIKPVVNQIEVNPWKRMDDLVAYCQSHSITVECYSPLTLGKMLKDPELVALANKYGKSTAQVQLRYLTQRDIVPIPKTTSRKRMEENLDIFTFELSADEMKSLGDPKRYVMAIPGWDPTNWD